MGYAEPDTLNAQIAYTSSDFIQKRHNVHSDLHLEYHSSINQVIEYYSKDLISITDVFEVKKGFGIVKIKPDFYYETTVQKLRHCYSSK